MLELIPQGLNIDVVGKAEFCITVSLLIILLGLGCSSFRIKEIIIDDVFGSHRQLNR